MTITLSDLRRVEGVRLALRLVEPAEADYIHGLRTNHAYNTYLSSVSGTAEDQRAWIERYKTREAEGLEYYYVIERPSDGFPFGTVRLYNIEAESFTWGSWILDANKPAKAALESAVLSFGIGFELLRKKRALIDVRRDNARALNFYRRFGMQETGEDGVNIYFVYSADRYAASKAAHLQVIEEEADT